MTNATAAAIRIIVSHGYRTTVISMIHRMFVLLVQFPPPIWDAHEGLDV
jgi:hypothetical protein